MPTFPDFFVLLHTIFNATFHFSVQNTHMTLLIADSGSTKTDWILHDNHAAATTRFATAGINPCLMSDEAISASLRDGVLPHLGATGIDRVHFYGAGCRPDQHERMARLITDNLHAAQATVASDLLGAAHALCGHEAGIVAILGTGSGSAVYDGCTFVAQTPSLGYILGDEGSGAVMGRRLLGDVFKRQLPPAIIEAFDAECGTTIDEAIRRVYREAAPNRYLAGFTRFLATHRDDAAVRKLIVNCFHDFFVRNIAAYERRDLAVNCVGSIAAVFEAELREAAAGTGFSVGRILRSPAEALLDYCVAP